MGVGCNFCQGFPWFRPWLSLGFMRSLDFGEISGSVIDFEPKGFWGEIETAGENMFGGRVLSGEI